MGVQAKEALLRDIESGVQPSAERSCAPSFCLPPLALLRRKKWLVLVLLAPTLYLMLVYSGRASVPFDYTSASDAGAHVLDSLHASLHHAAPAINELAGKTPATPATPAPPHHYDNAQVDGDGHLHNALLDELNVQGTPELTQLMHKIQSDAAAAGDPSSSTSDLDLALQLGEMAKFDAKDESMLLLLHALRQPGFTVDDDWSGVFVDRTPLEGGLFASLNAGPTNKFTQLLAKVGLPKATSASNATASSSPSPPSPPSPPKFSILNDAHQMYSLSRADWVAAMRPALGLTVFSKSYCAYSKRAKALLNQLNATYTLYEVDTRADAHNLQPLLAKLTGHTTFPTILARDRLLGGNDDLHDLHHIRALTSILRSLDAL